MTEGFSSVKVGGIGLQQVTFTPTTTVSNASVQVVTQGVTGLDFSLDSTTCTGTITAGNSCTVNVIFTPLAPGLRRGAVELSGSGGLVSTQLISGVGQGPALAFSPSTQTTAPATGLSQPYGVAVDAAGDVFIGEPGANLVYKVTPGGVQTGVGTITGHPYGLAVDGAGDVYIAELNNNRVVKVTPAGVQTTVPATGLTQPIAVAVDGSGDVFISDRNNNRVVEITPSGVQTTVPATGLNQPYGIALDAADDVFIADYNNNRVVEVTPGGVQTTVPTNGLTQPYGVTVDAAGDVFIASYSNGDVVEVTPGGVETTVPASGLSGPSGVAVDGAGDIFISDYNNNRVVEMVDSQPPSLAFANTNEGSISIDSPQSVTLQNIGNLALDTAGPGLVVNGPNFVEVAGTGTPADCDAIFAAGPLAPGADCNLSISFEPQAVGPLTSTAVITDNALNGSPATQTINLSGTGVTVIDYTLTVSDIGTGSGTVTDGSQIACTETNGINSGSCSGSYSSGTGVTLTASPTGTSQFLG